MKRTRLMVLAAFTLLLSPGLLLPLFVVAAVMLDPLCAATAYRGSPCPECDAGACVIGSAVLLVAALPCFGGLVYLLARRRRLR